MLGYLFARAGVDVVVLGSVVVVVARVVVVVGSVVNPLLQIAIVLIYLDLRVRREGIDLFQLAQRVTSPQPAL